MDFLEILKAFFLGIVQGVTEWLPISSTGHMIIIESIFKFNLSKTFVDTFFVLVQLGSIFAVIILFFNKLSPFKKDKQERNSIIMLWLKIAVATIPVVIVGFLFSDKIDSILYKPLPVAIMLIFYGLIFLIMEKIKKEPKINSMPEISFKLAFAMGIFQMLALVPGTSRSGATIIGAVFLGASRYVAAEFSFFLAIPSMVGASAYKLLKLGFAFNSLEIVVLLVGMITAFVVSLFVIKFLLGYIKKHDFKVFGYYRIILGLIIILFYLINR